MINPSAKEKRENKVTFATNSTTNSMSKPTSNNLFRREKDSKFSSKISFSVPKLEEEEETFGVETIEVTS